MYLRSVCMEMCPIRRVVYNIISKRPHDSRRAGRSPAPRSVPSRACYANFLAPLPQSAARELVIRNIDGKTVTVPLDRDRISLGRSSANELCYPDDAGLSRQHLALTRAGDSWLVEDLGSKNGTVLNGNRIDKAPAFNQGDRISTVH